VAAPKTGVTRVGDVFSTFEPDPVLVVTPVPPLVTSRALVKAKLVPVAAPNAGVTNVGDVDSTFAPEPVLVVTPVPPFATGKTPLTPDVRLTTAGDWKVACKAGPLLVSIVPIAPGVVNSVVLAAV
jgi:hypothetical protein